ncbi:hypothetical protein HJC10_33815 [Corallococcus exiguus]|uniref:hypothetical protein n=1 Tax=Corallococcus exiguus TaxID=83462 RepID=UPI001471BAA5|nr:hypothetical protein [Corallococcus exiguus]NNB89462.1 hypothetical protein [Corallococcus exiguus]NNB92639.1 hypothetical protein [Corallococcus exiguus]NNC07807.1 hypothetical protein [Corallococcus exiguus]
MAGEEGLRHSLPSQQYMMIQEAFFVSALDEAHCSWHVAAEPVHVVPLAHDM